MFGTMEPWGYGGYGQFHMVIWIILTIAVVAGSVERFEWHYTPKHGSWLDMAESELGVLASQCLNRRIVVVSAQVSLRDLKPAPFSAIVPSR
jgi:hypothetical protein